MWQQPDDIKTLKPLYTFSSTEAAVIANPGAQGLTEVGVLEMYLERSVKLAV